MARTEDELSENELTKRQYKKVLHEPMAPYLASVYNILTHLIQGLVLAALFFVMSIQTQITPLVLSNLIISFGFVVVIWHTFINHNQYIVMRISVIDTLLPIILAICQVTLALAINQPIYIHTLLIFPIIIMLEIIALNAYIKNKDPMALEIFKEHFKDLGTQFAQDFYDEFRNFEEITIKRNMITLFIILSILTIFNYFAPLNLTIKTYISTIVVGIIIILIGYYDLNRYFNNSKKLKKYGYKW
jgi:D-ribose pyranose/furanose isomerase RbsD